MNKTQAQHCRDIVKRVEERSLYTNRQPITLELVRAVIGTSKDLIDESVLKPANLPVTELDVQEVLRTWEIVRKWEVSSGLLAQVQAIMLAFDQAIAEASSQSSLD
jgi:hypothetical protein